MFSAAELSEIGTFMNLAMKEANTQAEVWLCEQIQVSNVDHA